MREIWVRSLGWEDPLEKERLPTPVFCPGEFRGLYSPWGGKELDTTEQLSLHIGEVNGNLEEKSPPAMQETLVRFLSWEDPLGKG